MSRHIVVVTPWLPLPADFGGALRAAHLVRELARHHAVTVLCPARDDELQHAIELGAICDVVTVPSRWTPRHPAGAGKRVQQIRSIGSRTSFLERSTWSAQLQRVLDRLFLTSTVDVVLYESTRMALFRPPTPCATVVDAYDVEAELLRRVARTTSSDVERALKLAEAYKVEQLERRLWRMSDMCIATSDRDARAIEAVSGAPTRVVPNGVDTAAFTRPEGWTGRRDIVFTGVMRHQPNSDAARWFLDDIHPLISQRTPHARVVFAGADPPDWLRQRANDDILVTGRVDDIRPWLWSAAVAIVPLRSGGGTRLKILEALAADVPVVSTSLGAEGIDGIESCTILADDNVAFADAVVEVLNDATLVGRLREHARQLVQHYDWCIIGQSLGTALDEAIERFGAGHDGNDAGSIDWAGRLWQKG